MLLAMANIPLSPKPKKYGPAFRTWKTYFQTIFTKFSGVQKNWIFPKNF